VRLPSGRPQTALVVIDMQRNVIGDAVDVERVVANINTLAERARAEGAPVVWVQHADDELERGSPGWELVDELARDPGDLLVHKRFGDSFEQTDLEEMLEDHAVGRLVVTGAQTDACVRSTLHGAFVRGYDTVLVTDGHTTEDMRAWGAPIGPHEAIAYTNLYWSFSNAPGRSAAAIPTAEVNFTR
jgi:nicotinamidase-related amidase